MYKLECALVESALKDVAEQPLLSVVIPTYHRAPELVVAVSSIATQLTGGLERKVEIIITDNGSGPETVQIIKALAEKFPSVSYLLHARDEGGFFQFFAAPWRARGRWTWVFGSDDALAPSGMAHVVELLEREQPSLMTLNKRIMNNDLSQVLNASVNAVPDRRFETYVDMFCALGINQFAFISSTIESTEAARAIDPRYYLTADTRHPHLAAYLEKHVASPSYYSSSNYLVHRVDNSPMLEYHSGNFFDYGVTLPCILAEVAARVGAPANLFARINGDKFIQSYDPPTITYLEVIIENILRALACGKYMTVGQRYKLEAIFASYGLDRSAQFIEVWDRHQRLFHLESASNRAKAVLDQERRASLEASAAFAR